MTNVTHQPQWESSKTLPKERDQKKREILDQNKKIAPICHATDGRRHTIISFKVIHKQFN